MKTVCLFILTLLALYNDNLRANTNEFLISKLQDTEERLQDIKLERSSPMRNLLINTEEYYGLLDLYSQFRDYNLEISKKILTKIENRKTLSSDDLYLIKRSLITFHKMNLSMMEFADLYSQRRLDMPKELARRDNKEVIKAHLIWLSANVTVLDHIIATHEILYSQEAQLRRIIKNNFKNSETDPQSNANFQSIVELLKLVLERSQEKKFTNELVLIFSIKEELKSLLMNDFDSYNLLMSIYKNKTAIMLASGKPHPKLSFYNKRDFFVNFIQNIIASISQTFGNAAGAVRWRSGHLFNDTKAYERINKQLIPMDILTEKTPFILTDKLIPGHYGHVALYLGTRTQLEQIGMWNHPSIVPYQNDIINGKTILEAVRSGVRLTSLKAFLDIDEVAIIRKSHATENKTVLFEQLLRSMDQMGKKYDFNFDISTLDKIVCSEIIYIAFGHVAWPTLYRLGRPTISPDEVAEILYHKGTEFKLVDSFKAPKKNEYEDLGILNLAGTFNFELRASDGSPLKDHRDPTNSFWKKETKCFNLIEENNKSFSKTKHCKLSFKEYQYEEYAY